LSFAYANNAAAEVLCSALFDFHYVRYVDRRLPA